MLYDEDAEDVFSIRELSEYNVPLFKTHKDANAFLENLERTTNRTFGRVPTKDYVHDVGMQAKERFENDNHSTREKANREDREQRNQMWNRGKF